MVMPVALAQSSVPEAPTAVAVYSIESEKLEVRWSSSIAASTTSFKVQWKLGTQEFDSSRQVSSDPATSVVSVQSTSAGDRYVETIAGLTDGTEYTVRVIAANANGDGGPSGEATGTPQSTPGQAVQFFENEVVNIFEDSFPWLRDTWDYITAQNVPVTMHASAGGAVGTQCSPDRPMESNLRKCYGTLFRIGRSSLNLIYVITHELAHVYTLANSVTDTPGPLGAAFLYFSDLTARDTRGGSLCGTVELYADALTLLVHGDRARGRVNYWTLCSVTTDSVTEEALSVVRSAASGEMPSWFADTYNDSDGDPDLERVWADVKAIQSSKRRAAVVFQLRGGFGGYCDNQKATASAFAGGVSRNPWSDGGCVPGAPASVAAAAVGSGKLTVSWQEPPDDGGSPIEGYKVQWKSGTQEYGSSRQAVVTSLSDLRRTVGGLTNDEGYTLRVLAYNYNGDGAATEITHTPTATDATAPALLAARVDGVTLRLIWREALDGSSEPATSAFTVNVNGSSRGIGEVSVSGDVATFSLESAVSAGDTVTVSYTAPTGSGAMPLRDSAENNASGFSGQMVRNDTTLVAITSDPGTDMTYIWGHGFGREDVIEATVTFSESVLVSGVPELTLLVGGEVQRAAYRRGSGTTSLVFGYVLTEGDSDTDGVSVPGGAISMAGGLIRYASTKSPAPAQVELAAQSAHLVDAVRPVLVSANAVANRNDVTLIWDRALDETSQPTPGGVGFSVVDFGDNTRVDISTISVLGRVVTLTLSSAVSAGDQLRVSYGVPFRTHPPLKDSLGNYAGSNSAVVAITERPNRPAEFPSSEDGARSVNENTPANRTIGTPIAADDADNDRLTYSISGADAAFFEVVAASGQLRTKEALNHESRGSYSFTMSVHDGRDIHNNSDTSVDDTISVTVTVNDVDEPADISFSVSSGVTTSENALAVDENHSGALATFSASDPENKAGLTYIWQPGGADRASFAMTADGVLAFVNIPDYERPEDRGRNNVYSTGVDVRDSDGKVGYILFTVTVDPVDEPPAVTGDATVSIEEAGTLRVGTYQASDPEGAVTAWRPLAGDDRDRFEFTASNGRLAFNAAPDFEEAADSDGDNVYDVTLGVSAGGKTTTFDVAVSVTNKDESAALGFSSQQPQAEADFTATLSDPDVVLSTTWTWERSTSRNGPWTVVTGATSGVTESVYRPVAGDVGHYLRATAAYTDRHGPNKSRVGVSARSVKAANPDNVAPSFSDRTPTRSIAENARSRVTVGVPVTATDTDSGDVVTYELSGSDLFMIDSASGQIRVVTGDSLDYETAPSHSVTVEASDTSNASDTVTVTIEVTDVNEPPVAVADTGRAREDGDVTIDVLANDSDQEDDRSALTLRVITRPRRGSATVKEPANAGENHTIKYTPNTNYHGSDIFTYEVGDTGSPSLTRTATVSVDIDGVNDPPTFTSPTTTRSVSENAKPGDQVGAPVTARDVDDNDTLTYSLFGTDASFFDIGPRSGQITVGDFDIKTKNTYTVMVDADDRDSARATVEVTITVTSRPPPPPPPPPPPSRGGGGVSVPPAGSPAFVEGARASRTVAENTGAGVDIGEPVTATDPDEDPLTYTLIGSDRVAFDVDASSGQLRTRAPLDYETKDSYALSVSVRDSKDPEGEPDKRRDDLIRVTVNVGNVDEDGWVTLSAPTPRTGTPIEAAVSDPDGGIGDIVWVWEKSADQITWTAIQDADSSAYTPTGSDQDHYLRAAATYVDGHGPTKAASTTTDTAVTTATVTTFTDVTPDGTHTQAITTMATNGVFADTECGPDVFCPDEPIQRWVIAVWLIRALGQDPATVGESRFDDITRGQWWIRYAEQLADRQITLGCDTNPLRFCPEESVTRAQMASFLVRAFNLPPAGTPAEFTDTQGNTHQDSINALAAAGITEGCDTDPLRYCPNQAVTRAQLATFLNRALQHQPAT